jgi:hypothetical protein
VVGRHAPGRPGKVPVGPVRDVFEASGLTAREVAREIGWVSPQRRRDGTSILEGDSSRLRRRLGITKEISRGLRYNARSIDAEVAGLIAEACGQPAWTVMPDEEMAA